MTSSLWCRRDEWKSRDWVRQFREFTEGPDVCRPRAAATGTDPDHVNGLIEAIERMHERYEQIDPAELGEYEGFLGDKEAAKGGE